MRKLLPLLALAVASMPAAAQLRSGYVDWGKTGPDFGAALVGWHKGQAWTQDDNFFISRVALHPRFRDAFTQVNTSLDEGNDKNLLFWVPINSPGFNALPDGKWDCEVFPMWQYVTHYGNWSTSLVRVPAAFTDAAHRNGVPVSCVAGIPYGGLNQGWRNGLQAMIDAGADKVADFMLRYGVDGLGYNSEFSGGSDITQKLAQMHSVLRQRLGGVNCVWYDGSQWNGGINFDMGLTNNNAPIWGGGDDPRTLLFFNYNWNRASLISNSIAKARELGRSPLDLYCGFNMQGSEPKQGTRWPMLVDEPLSIGLWGAHSENMFWESRGEQGPDAASKQRAYMERVERWFTGGTRNPLNCPPVSDAMSYNAKNYDFFGMSSFMSARSSLSWDLAQEPLVTHFNLGNGRFFNFRGQRRNSLEWYNLGIQDHLPTWRWWLASSLLGRGAEAVPAQGLDAEFVWDDAYFGGSCVRVHGTTDNEYLHLFKTRYDLKAGDQVTFTYKMTNGAADAYLVLGSSTEGDTPRELRVADKSHETHGTWVTRTFTAGTDFEPLQLTHMALRVAQAEGADMLLGGLSVTRPGAYGTPVTPEVTSAEVLHASHEGVDAKVIFNVPNAVEPDRTCLNTDVNTSMFAIYAQQEGREPVMMGATSSWAAIAFRAPVDLEGDLRVRLGVSALSLDMATESPVAWSDYMDVMPVYETSDAITNDAGLLHPGEPFTISYSDPLHPAATWALADSEGRTVATAEASTELSVASGVPALGNYDLTLNCRGTVTRYPAYLQAVAESCGSQPRILTLDVPAETEAGTSVEAAYTGAEADGQLSRGVQLSGEGTGFRWKDTGVAITKSFSIAFWMRSDGWEGANSLLNIRDKTDSWPKNAWGWLWSTINNDGTPGSFVIRGTSQSLTYTFGNTVISPNVWHHYAYVFEFDNLKKVVPHFFLDGVEQDITSWMVGDTEQSLPVKPTGGIYRGLEGNVVSVGGALHTTSGVRGALDNLQFYTRALTADDMAAVMGDSPVDVAGWWSFDSEPDAEGWFPSQGDKAIPAGAVAYSAREGEGQGNFGWRSSVFTGGCPMLAPVGAYDVATTATWTLPGAKVTPLQGTDTQGRATLSFPTEGTYEGTLTLTNCHGSDTRPILVNVRPGSGISEAAAERGLQVEPRVFRQSFTVTGTGRLTMTDMAGRTVLVENVDGTATVSPLLPSGTYVVSLGGLSAKVVKM